MALRLPKQDYQDIERVIELDFVRATEAAALNSLRWLGRGDKEAADAAASDAIRGMFDLMNICGEVVIGEGIKDNAPGIFKGEQLGTWYPGSPEFHIAIDPIDGTTNISKGAPNSISCIAAASPEEGVKVALRDIPSFYMSKLAYGPRVIEYMAVTSTVKSVSGIHSCDFGRTTCSVSWTYSSTGKANRGMTTAEFCAVSGRPFPVECATKSAIPRNGPRMVGDMPVTLQLTVPTDTSCAERATR